MRLLSRDVLGASVHMNARVHRHEGVAIPAVPSKANQKAVKVRPRERGYSQGPMPPFLLA